MKPKSWGLFLLATVLLGAGRGQWLEKTVGIPDSLSCVVTPRCIAYNPVNEKVYVGGQYSNELLVMDATSHAKLARVAVGVDVKTMCFNPTNNKLYVGLGTGRGVRVLSGATDSVLATINGKFVADLCYNHIDNKTYAAIADDGVVYVIDGVSNAVTDTVITGEQPNALCFNSASDKVYCADFDSNWVTVIDGVTNARLATVRVGLVPGAFCVNPVQNKVYCANTWGGTVSVIDGVGDSLVKVIQMPTKYATELCYNERRNKVYCAFKYPDSGLVVIDGSTDTISAIVRHAGKGWHERGSLWYDDSNDRVFMANNIDDDVTVVDGGGDSLIARAAVRRAPEHLLGIAVDSTVYCVCRLADDLSILSRDECRVEATVHVGSRPAALCLDSSNSKLYCANLGGTVSVLDAIEGRPLTTLTTGYYSCALCQNSVNNKAYCASYEGGGTAVIDCVRDSVVAIVGVGDSMVELCYNQTSNKVYCSRRGVGVVKVVDGANNTIIRSLTISQAEASDLCYNSTNNKVYALCAQYRDLGVIDGQTDSILRTITTGIWPCGLCYNTTSNKVYCANSVNPPYYDSTVSIYDGTDDHLITSLIVRPGPHALCFDRNDNKVYLANASVITVIDGDSDRVRREVPIGRAAVGLWHSQTSNRLFCVSMDGNVTVIDCDRDTILKVIRVGERSCAVIGDSLRGRVYVANNYGCSVSIIQDTFCTGADDSGLRQAPNAPLSICVNPCAGILKLSLQLTTDGPEQRIQLFDVTGRQVKAVNVPQTALRSPRWLSVDLRDLPDGVYFVGLSDGSSPSASSSRKQKVVLAR